MRLKRNAMILVGVVMMMGLFGAATRRGSDHDAGAGYSVAQAHSDGADGLAQQFADAFRSRDLGRLKACFCWDGVDAWTRQTVEESLVADLQHPLVDVALLPTEADRELEYEVGGVRYAPNLPVTGQLKVTYQRPGESEPAWTSYLLGKQGDKHWIALAAPVR